MRRGALVAVVPILVAIAVGAVHAQMPDSVPLLPDTLWTPEAFHAPDGTAEMEVLEPEGGAEPLGCRVHVSEVPTNRWEICLAWDTVAPIAAGDVMLLTFDARAESEREPAGQINLAFRRTQKPYHHALSDTVSVGEDWQTIRVPLSPTVDMPAGGGTLRINLGTQRQVVELRDVSLHNYGGDLSYLAVCRMLDIDPGSGGRMRVGTPLRPGLLWEMRAFDELPALDPDFDPAGSWEQTWRIWTNYGYVRRGNHDLGRLRITRSAGDPFQLRIDQIQLNTEGLQHVQTADVTCALDALASPLTWTLTSEFITPGREQATDLRSVDTVEESPTGPVTADWCLFEAVQRLPFDEDTTHRFNLLEGLSLPKHDYELRYMGAQEIAFGANTRTLHCFQQTGHGTLAYRYWLDETHRLVLVISHCRAYILDPNADAVLAEEIAKRAKRYERRRTRWEQNQEDDDGE